MLSIKVLYKNQLVGIVSVNPDNKNYYIFRYSDEFIKSGIQLCPLAMPLSPTNYIFTDLSIESFKGLPPLLVDSLPDKYGSELLLAWQKMFNKTGLSALEALSYIGKRGMGALEFVPAVDELSLNESQLIEIDSLVEIANQLLNDRQKLKFDLSNAKLTELISVGSSVGGARAKAVVAIDKQGNIKSGQIAGLKDAEYCIIKFDGLNSDFSEDKNVTYYTRIEYAYYLMATASGINMNPCSLLKINGKYHFKTVRFDRDINGNKIHMLSLAGMVGFDYMRAGEHSYEEIAKVLMKLGCDPKDRYQLFKRMVFNVVCKNHDDHVKNFSFLMEKDNEYKLSPAYDLSYSYNPFGDWTKHHQMTINGKVDDFVLDDFYQAASEMNIDIKKAKKMINEVIEVAKKFKEFAKQAEIPDDISKLIYNQFVFFDN